MRLLQLPVEQIELRLRLRNRHSRLQSPDHRQRIAPTVGLLRQREGRQDVDSGTWREGGGEIESRRRYAHYSRRLVVERKRASDHSRVCREASYPVGVAQDHCRAAVPAALFFVETASEQRRNSQQRKEVLRHADADYPFWFAHADHVVAAVVEEGEVGRQVLERFILRAPVIKVGHAYRYRGEAASRPGIRDPDQSFRVAKRQRAEKQRVDDAENSRVRADAKRQR